MPVPALTVTELGASGAARGHREAPSSSRHRPGFPRALSRRPGPGRCPLGSPQAACGWSLGDRGTLRAPPRCPQCLSPGVAAGGAPPAAGIVAPERDMALARPQHGGGGDARVQSEGPSSPRHPPGCRAKAELVLFPTSFLWPKLVLPQGCGLGEVRPWGRRAWQCVTVCPVAPPW